MKADEEIVTSTSQHENTTASSKVEDVLNTSRQDTAQQSTSLKENGPMKDVDSQSESEAEKPVQSATNANNGESAAQEVKPSHNEKGDEAEAKEISSAPKKPTATGKPATSATPKSKNSTNIENTSAAANAKATNTAAKSTNSSSRKAESKNNSSDAKNNNVAGKTEDTGSAPRSKAATAKTGSEVAAPKKYTLTLDKDVVNSLPELLKVNTQKALESSNTMLRHQVTEFRKSLTESQNNEAKMKIALEAIQALAKNQETISSSKVMEIILGVNKDSKIDRSGGETNRSNKGNACKKYSSNNWMNETRLKSKAADIAKQGHSKETGKKGNGKEVANQASGREVVKRKGIGKEGDVKYDGHGDKLEMKEAESNKTEEVKEEECDKEGAGKEGATSGGGSGREGGAPKSSSSKELTKAQMIVAAHGLIGRNRKRLNNVTGTSKAVTTTKPVTPKAIGQTRPTTVADNGETIRDNLRNASTIPELKAAIQEAANAGLRFEVQLGERKLAKMTA